MPRHLVLTTCAATAAATTGTAATALAGDSLVQRNYGRAANIIAAWQTNQTAGFGQITFPTAHDTTRGFRVGVPAAATEQIMALGLRMPCDAQETLSINIAATAVAGDVENISFLTQYDVDKGQRFMSWEQVRSRLEKVTTIEASLVSVAGPAYGPAGGESIDTDSNLLIANRDYALLGFSSRTRVHCIAWQGPDTGNDKIGCPGTLRPEITQQWFKLLSAAHGEPMIPIINSGNRAQTNWFVATDENAGTFLVTAHLVLLK